MQVHIMCGAKNSCGFRVHSEYYRDKARFAPGVCARCSGPIAIVEAFTENAVPGARMSLAVHREGGGAILGLPAA